MDSSNPGKSANSSFSIRYNANNEELEDVFAACDDDPPTPHTDPSVSPTATLSADNASPKRLDKSGSIIDKYFKSIRAEKLAEDKQSELKEKTIAEEKVSSQKDVNSSPMKEYLHRLGKKGKDDLNIVGDGKDVPNETWKIFQDFKVKIAQAVEEMKSSRANDEKEKSATRESVSDSEENSGARDADQQSVGDTDNQVSSLHSSIHNLSEQTPPVTAKGTTDLPDKPKNVSESSDDTQKNFQLEDAIEDDNLDVESGVEALEESNLGPSDGSFDFYSDLLNNKSSQAPLGSYLDPESDVSSPNTDVKTSTEAKKFYITFPMGIFTLFVMLSFTFLSTLQKWNGFLMGIWTLIFAKAGQEWLNDLLTSNSDKENYEYFEKKRKSAPVSAPYIIPPIKEHKPIKKFEGWINHYRFSDYDPNNYNLNQTTTAFMKLEDRKLRISYTRSKISKKAMWNESIEEPLKFYQHRLYNLAGARVILLPKGLVSKRYWSKKYPICVVLGDKEKVRVLERERQREKKDGSPEKRREHEDDSHADKHKKKFVWRRKEKDSVDSIGKAGLRHRLTRKMHKDKKTEDASTSTDPVTILTDHSILDDEEQYIASVINTKTKEEPNTEDETDNDQMREYLNIFDETEEAENTENTEASTWNIHIKDPRNYPRNIYIFARTGREKHEWYRRLLSATDDTSDEPTEDSVSEQESEKHMNVFRVADKDAVAYTRLPGSAYNVAPESVVASWTEETLKTMNMRAHERDFWPYMNKIIQGRVTTKSEAQSTEDSSGNGRPSTPDGCSLPNFAMPADIGWLNAALGRIAYDAMRNPAVVSRIQQRIQRKLNTLKLPALMGALVATELSLGCAPPLVQAVTGPTCDEKGIWLEADVLYNGGAYITLHTKINLMKLNEKSEAPSEYEMDQLNYAALVDTTLQPQPQGSPSAQKRKSAIYDSDVDDSPETSSDEECSRMAEAVPVDERQPTSPDQTPLRTNSSDSSSAKKFLRMVDKITTSRYFQQISDYKVVKRAMEGLSNTDIKLHLEVKGLEGRLAINLPPPPHDRVWFGFRTNPRLWLKARPALGTRAVRITHITNWIEQRLCKEVEKVLVMPNMEDITIDLLTPTPVEFE